MTTILVTGAYGFIGKHLSVHLSKLGHEVIGLGHGVWNETEASNWGIKKWINADVQINNLRKVCFQKKPKIIFHLAGGATVSHGEKNPEEDFFKNVTSTSELLEWLRLDLPQSKLIVTSSASIYGQGINNLIPEDFIGKPYSNYGKNKNEMEILCQFYKKKYNLNLIIARLFSVYGPELKKQLLWELCNRLIKKESPIILGGSGKEMRDWIYIDDVVNILSFIGLDQNIIKKEYIINVGTGVGSAVKEITKIVLSNWNNLVNFTDKSEIEFSGKKRSGDPFSLVADTTRLSKLGLQCQTNPKQGINNYISWFKKYKNL
tara:strand:+ start:96 stop:1049 length:954 start_codon:yes stop_codon:yes gene_type:complete